MGQVFAKAPTTSYFVVGYCIGFPIMWYAPDSVFARIRNKFIPTFEKFDMRIDPAQSSMKLDEKKIVNNLIKLEGKDEEYDGLRQAYTKRMKDYARNEEDWYNKRSLKNESEESLKEITEEYEAIKRVHQKK